MSEVPCFAGWSRWKWNQRWKRIEELSQKRHLRHILNKAMLACNNARDLLEYCENLDREYCKYQKTVKKFSEFTPGYAESLGPR